MKEAIRNFIIDKAKNVFEKKGFRDATLEEIAKAASVSIPTLYNYFPGKKDLFIEVIKTINVHLDSEFQPIFQSDIDFLLKIEKLFEKLLSFVHENTEIVRISFFDPELYMDMYKHDSGDLMKTKERRLQNLKRFIDQGKKEGFVNRSLDSETISMVITGMVHELFFKMIFKKDGVDNRKIIEDLIDIFKNGILKK